MNVGTIARPKLDRATMQRQWIIKMMILNTFSPSTEYVFAPNDLMITKMVRSLARNYLTHLPDDEWHLDDTWTPYGVGIDALYMKPPG